MYLSLISLSALMIAFNVLLTAYLFYKTRKMHLAIYRIEDNTLDSGQLFNQIQAYHGLVSIVKPRKPIPPLRGWAASPDFLFIISSYVLSRRPETVLECGSGASTVVLARCCELNGTGHVYSLEHDLKFAEKTRSQLENHGLTQWATVVDAPLVEYETLGRRRWYSLEYLDLASKPVDLLIVDGPPNDLEPLARWPVLPLLHDKLSNNWTLFLDDANRGNEKQVISKWVSQYPAITCEMLEAEKGCAMLSAGGERGEEVVLRTGGS